FRGTAGDRHRGTHLHQPRKWSAVHSTFRERGLNMQHARETTMLDHALALAAKGFHVFPLKAGAKAPPLIKDFPKRATRDEKTIREWWAQWPKANIGISTSRFGEGEALIAVDVDNKNGKRGSETIVTHELAGRTLPATYEQHTPTGGRHLCYRVPAPLGQGVNTLGDGVDTRSNGGYIVGAGSRVEAGEYTGS